MRGNETKQDKQVRIINPSWRELLSQDMVSPTRIEARRKQQSQINVWILIVFASWRWSSQFLFLYWLFITLWALSIRPNILVWNSGYSMRRMEQDFPVRWTNQSQVTRFQVSRKNTRSNGGLFYLCFLALELLDDSEVEINDVLGKGDDITFIVRI